MNRTWEPLLPVDRVPATAIPSGTRQARTASTPLSLIGATLAERPYARRGAPPRDGIIRVLLIEQQSLMRLALRALLRQSAEVEVIAEAADGPAAGPLIETRHPDLIVLGLGIPTSDGLRIIRDLQRATATQRILVLTPLPEEDGLIEALEAGASGYLTTDAGETDMLEALRVIASGDTYVRPQVARLLAAHQRSRGQSPRDRQRAAFERLSQREQVVVERFAQGFAGVEIGRQLGISNKTIETYKERIADKLGLRHRSEYVRYALEIGLLHP